MKKLFVLFSIIIPFLAHSQDSVWLYGSTTNAKNKVIARNDFQVNGSFFLGIKDTTFTPTRNGIIVVRPQDGKPYYFILNAGGQQWNQMGVGNAPIYTTNGLHIRNDSTISLGGKMDSPISISLRNLYQFQFDSAQAGFSRGFRVNFGSDNAWDLFTRDSITGYWTRIPKGSVGQSLQMLASGGIGWAAQQGAGSGNQSLSFLQTNPSNVPITISGTGGNTITIQPATRTTAGWESAADKSRGDSTTFAMNGVGTGDSLFLSVANGINDTLYIKRQSFSSPWGLTWTPTFTKYKNSYVVIPDTLTTASGLLPIHRLADSTAVLRALIASGGNTFTGPVTGTANRIAVSTGSTTPVIDISANYVGQTSITTLGPITTGSWTATPIGTTYGGVPSGGSTNQILTKNSNTNYDYSWINNPSFISPMTTFGDIIYQGSSSASRLAGNITTTRMFLAQVGNGTTATAPLWYTPGANDVNAWLAYTPENVGNKSTSVSLGTSNTVYPSQNAVKSYVDNSIAAIASSTLTFTNKSIDGGSNSITNISEGSFAFTNITTANASTSAHGLLPKLSGNVAQYLDGTGAFSVPASVNIGNSDLILSASRTLFQNSNPFAFNGGSINMIGSARYIGNPGAGLNINQSILDNGFTGASGTQSLVGDVKISQSPMSASNTNVTYTNAASLIIDGPPVASTNVTITNPYSLYIGSGNSYFGGSIRMVDGNQAAGKIMVSDANGVGSWAAHTLQSIFNAENRKSILSLSDSISISSVLDISGSTLFLRPSVIALGDPLATVNTQIGVWGGFYMPPGSISASGTTENILSSYVTTVLDPASVLSSKTYNLPATGTLNDGQIIKLLFGGTITSGAVVTTLTINTNTGQTFLGTKPTTANAGDEFIFIFRKVNNSLGYWFREK